MTWNRFDPAQRATRDNGKPETKRANQALRDYLYMGAARSLRKLIEMYANSANPPTRSWNSISSWSAGFAWVARAERFDEIQREKAQAEYDARRREIMETGLALDHERVEKLKRLHAQLDEYLKREDLVWLKDSKSIRVGTSLKMSEDGKLSSVGDYEVIDTITFNAALIGKYLETIEALAAETGGRVRKAELSGPHGGPIRTSHTPVDLSKLSDDDLAALEALLEKADADADEPGRSAG